MIQQTREQLVNILYLAEHQPSRLHSEVTFTRVDTQDYSVSAICNGDKALNCHFRVILYE